MHHDKDHPFYILCGWMTKEDAEALHRDLAKDADTFFVLEGQQRARDQHSTHQG